MVIDDADTDDRKPHYIRFRVIGNKKEGLC